MSILSALAPVLLAPVLSAGGSEPVAPAGPTFSHSAVVVGDAAFLGGTEATARSFDVTIDPRSDAASGSDAESVVTDRRAPIYGPRPAAGVEASASAVRLLQGDVDEPEADTMSGSDPRTKGDVPVPAALEQLSPLRPGLSDRQYYEALSELTLPNGLVLDRNSDRHTVSSAATGLVGYALAVLADRGVADRTAVAEHLRRGFDATLAANPTANRGWLSHFTDADGRPKRHSEVSTIDSALFYAGLLKAAQTLNLKDLEKDVRTAVDGVDVAWLTRDGVFLHGLEWPGEAGATEPRIIPYTWNDTSEGAILYRLFGLPFHPATHRTDLPLFTYFYPLVLWPDWDEAGSGRTGGGAWNPAEEPYRYDGPDYRRLLAAAMAWQHKTLGHAGVTAADGPGGYTAFRPTLVSPLMLSSLAPRFAEAADTLRAHDLDATLPAYDLDAGWDAPDRLAIDYASYFLLRAAVIEPGYLPADQTAGDGGNPALLVEVE